MKLFTDHHILSPEEMNARHDIILENYSKALQLEGRTMVEMMTKDLLPALLKYTADTASAVREKEALGLSTTCDRKLLEKMNGLYEAITSGTETLAEELTASVSIDDFQEQADFCHDKILASLEEIRVSADQAEALIPDSLLPYPTYDILLFSV